MNDNKMTVSELAKYYEIQIFKVLQLQEILGFGIASVILYKALKTKVTKL